MSILPDPRVGGGASPATQANIAALIGSFPSVDLYRLPGDIDDTAAFVRGFQANYTLYGTPGKIYTINGVVLNGRSFDGRGCIIQDAVGAPFTFQLTGFNPALRNVLFQDQGNVCYVTSNVGGNTAGGNTVHVANATGFTVGQQILIQGNGDLWEQTLIAGVAGTTITLRDALTESGGSGLKVVASFGLVYLTDSEHAHIQNLLFINTNVGVICSSSGPNTDVGSAYISELDFPGTRYCSFAKYGNCHDFDVRDIIAFCGSTDPFSYTGNGSNAYFGIGYKLDLIRDVSVYVAGVLQVFGTAYTFSDPYTVQFLAGHIPGAGVAVLLEHYHNSIRGFIEDQRSTTIASGGSRFTSLKILKAIICMELQYCTLSGYDSIIVDSCQLYGLYLNNCGFCVNFSQISATWSRYPIIAFNSSSVEIINLTTDLTPTNQIMSFSPTSGYEVTADATSRIDIDLPSWSSYTYSVNQLVSINLLGCQRHVFSSGAALAAGSTTYLSPGGPVNVHQPIDISDRDCFIVGFWAGVNISPGAGQTVTINIIEDADSAATVLMSIVITGTSSFGGFCTAAPATMSALHSLSVQVVYSSGAAASYVRGFFLMR